jgi:hypothetical protein
MASALAGFANVPHAHANPSTTCLVHGLTAWGSHSFIASANAPYAVIKSVQLRTQALAVHATSPFWQEQVLQPSSEGNDVPLGWLVPA